jgi:hypothetical protein
MTDRHTGYLITLDTPIRDDDSESLISAIKQLRGVIDVRPVVAGVEQISGAVRMESVWRNAVLKLARFGPDEI